MAILRKGRALKYKPVYLMLDAYTLYGQANEKFRAASAGFLEEAEARSDRIEELNALVAEEHLARDGALRQSETALDISEHLTKL